MNIVFYHKNCNDGLFAAYATWLKLADINTIYIPINYKPIQEMQPQEALDYLFNEEIKFNRPKKPITITKDMYKDITMYVVDYSFPVDHFDYHCENFNKVVLLDHHYTAIKDYTEKYGEVKLENDRIKLANLPYENATVLFSNNESGAKLTYNYFFPEQSVLEVIELVSDRDLWQFKLLNTKPFTSGIKAIEFNTFVELDLNIKYGISKILETGHIMERNTLKYIKQTIKSNLIKIDIIINNVIYKGGIVNNSDFGVASDLCSNVINNNDCDIAISYSLTQEGKVSCSVRSTKDVDSSVISRIYGGGGHKQASGFTASLDLITNIIQYKKLYIE